MSVTVINEMLGKVFVSAEKNDDGTELKFLEKNWFDSFTFYHVDDCCESVWIEDIEGELSDLEDSPLLEAEVVSNREETNSGSRTLTFFKFGTAKGHVVVRWCGESNGYYSESVSLKITRRIDF
ncbi:DUF7448 domain-containing protein [Klebsiella michiganensis]|uniref:DUF7448 domain-containing protein n=1 Tax=Klebsiella michiganensis TaxID=1134687 RepID=UPI001C68E482|nr:hypothetical protein [Klebsiella michiganensis]